MKAGQALRSAMMATVLVIAAGSRGDAQTMTYGVSGDFGVGYPGDPFNGGSFNGTFTFAGGNLASFNVGVYGPGDSATIGSATGGYGDFQPNYSPGYDNLTLSGTSGGNSYNLQLVFADPFPQNTALVPYGNINFYNYGSNFIYSDNYGFGNVPIVDGGAYPLAAVPEPSSVVMTTTACVFGLLYRRFGRRRTLA